MTRYLASLFWLLLALAGPAQAAPTLPALTGRVVDGAAMLPADQAAALDQRLARLEEETGRQLVVATVPDLQGYPIEDFANTLFRSWKLGDAQRDDGVLLLVAGQERKVRIEVGYGLEPILTDAMSGLIVRTAMLPAFRQGDMPGGIAAGVEAIAAQLALPPEEARARATQAAAAARRQQADPLSPMAIFWIVLLLFVILPMFLRRAGGRAYRRGRGPVILWGPGIGGGWGGGGGHGGGWGGGGFSGGGGSSGGGGASGSW